MTDETKAVKTLSDTITKAVDSFAQDIKNDIKSLNTRVTTLSQKNTSGSGSDVGNISGDVEDLKKNCITVYLSPTGSNTNDGLSADAPMLDVSGVMNKYRNLNQLIIKLLDGTYSDHFVLSDVPSITLVSASNDKDVVTITGGVECISTTVDIRNITIDGVSQSDIATGGYTALSFDKCIGSVIDSSVVDTSSYTMSRHEIVTCKTSKIWMTNCDIKPFRMETTFSAKYTSDVVMHRCAATVATLTPSNYMLVEASTGSIVKTILCDMVQESYVYYGYDPLKGITVGVSNGGTGAKDIKSAKANLALTRTHLIPEDAYYNYDDPIVSGDSNMESFLRTKLFNYSILQAVFTSGTYSIIKVIGVREYYIEYDIGSIGSHYVCPQVIFDMCTSKYSVYLSILVSKRSGLVVSYSIKDRLTDADLTSDWHLTEIYGLA